jgi:hypothetical protein
MDWDFGPMKRRLQTKPSLFATFLRCGEFIASNGDKYVLTFTTGDATPVTEVQEVYKLWLEDKGKTDGGSSDTAHIATALATIDALSMPTTGKIFRCHGCKEIVGADGEESNCHPAARTATATQSARPRARSSAPVAHG